MFPPMAPRYAKWHGNGLHHHQGSVVLLPKRPVSALRGIIKSERRAAPTIEEMGEAGAGAVAERISYGCAVDRGF